MTVRNALDGARAAVEAARRAVQAAALKPTEPAKRSEPASAPAPRQAMMTAAGRPPGMPDLSGGAPPATSLATEDRTDGSVNCLDVVGDFLLTASPQIRARSEVLFLRDTRGGAEGQSGHVVIRQGDRVFDPATRGWTDSAAWFRGHPEYQLAGTVRGPVAATVLAQPPGPARLAAMERAGVPAAVGQMMVADVGPTPALPPALRAAMDAYLAAPTPANFDGLVRTLALEQATHARTALQASRDRLAADPNALLGLQTVARQTQTLASYVLASTQLPRMPERFDTLRPFAQAVDPSWAQVSFEQLTQDPALYQRFLKDLDTSMGPLSGSGPLSPQGPNPELASALQDFRPTMDVLMGPPHAAGVALSESVKRAGEQLDYARKQYPELAALDLGTLLGTRDASQVVATLDARLVEVDNLVGALRTGTPGASDLFPIAMLAAQLVGSELVANPSTAHLNAFDAAFQSVQTIQQGRVNEQRVDLALTAVNLVASAGAFLATGGLSLLFFGTSLVTNVAQGKRSVDQYQSAQQLSQYNAGGILDMSGVKRPSESAFALEMAFTVLGVVGDVGGIAGALKGMSAVNEAASLAGAADTAITAANAGRGGAYFEEVASASSFNQLSEGARNMLAEWGIRSNAYYTAKGVTGMSDDSLLRVFQQSYGQGRTVTEAFRAGAITEAELVMWSTRGSSVAEAGSIVMRAETGFTQAETVTSTSTSNTVTAMNGGMPVGTLTITSPATLKSPMGILQANEGMPLADSLMEQAAEGRTFKIAGMGDLGVDKAFQRQGIASQMIGQSFDWARKQGIDFITGNFSEDGMVAVRAYCERNNIPFFSVSYSPRTTLIYIGDLPVPP